jgi:hypothetical protein
LPGHLPSCTIRTGGIDDLRLVERIAEAEEERLDLQEAKRALSDPTPAVPWEQARVGHRREVYR